MPAELLRDISRPSVLVPRRRWSMLPVSLGAHALAAVAILVMPLAAEVELPTPAPLSLPHFMVSLVPPPPPPAPPPGKVRETPTKPAAAPLRAPDGVKPEERRPPTAAPSEPGVDGGVEVRDGVAFGTGLLGAHATVMTAPPPPPPPPPPVRKGPVRIGQGVREPRKIVHVTPVYPTIARDNRVDGVVLLESIINERGEIEQIKVLHSVPLLDGAAIEAVRQWRYTPTLLNGVPVPVLMTIRVQFTLQR